MNQRQCIIALRGQQTRLSSSNGQLEKKKINYQLRIQQYTESQLTSKPQKTPHEDDYTNDENYQRDKRSQQRNQSGEKYVQDNRKPLRDITNLKTMSISKHLECKQEVMQLKSNINQNQNCLECPLQKVYNTQNFIQKESYQCMSSICPQAFTKQYFSSLISNQVDVQDCLKRHHINCYLRPKMIDWMIEVIVCMFDKPIITTLFRTVNLMDLFLKKSSTIYTDDDIHLIGVCCLFIINHFDQCIKINTNRFHKDIAHKIFDKKQMVAMEIKILQTIDFNLSFSIASDFNNQYIFFLKKCSKIPVSFISDITKQSYFYLMQSYYFEEMLSFQPRIIALASFFVALETLLGLSKENNSIIDNRISSIQKAILGEFNENMDSLMPSLAYCIKNINIISNNFKSMLPKMINYQNKFSSFILN